MLRKSGKCHSVYLWHLVTQSTVLLLYTAYFYLDSLHSLLIHSLLIFTQLLMFTQPINAYTGYTAYLCLHSLHSLHSTVTQFTHSLQSSKLFLQSTKFIIYILVLYFIIYILVCTKSSKNHFLFNNLIIQFCVGVRFSINQELGTACGSRVT